MKPLFDVLDPPAGGARAFRRRIVGERKKRMRRRRIVAGGATAAVVALAVFATVGLPLPSREAPATELDFTFARMRLGTLVAPDAAVTITGASRRDTAALQLPSRDERVVLYLVASRTFDEADEPQGPDDTSATEEDET